MNRLATETSPYLLQHSTNPVDWYAWGPKAFSEARDTGRPILLSSGYAACHWCHVMAHESFEDPIVAQLMNDHFINIKLDREERPDVDHFYMSSLHAMGEQGGWPLTMFLTPGLKPFWGGTYFPLKPTYGRPSFCQVLQAVAEYWKDRREDALGAAQAITAAVSPKPGRQSETTGRIPSISETKQIILANCDEVWGGLRGAPKFPNNPIFSFLWEEGLRYKIPEAAEAVSLTLQQICNGGITDHLGGGIARYSTDAKWLVPHFEKMLYDNAQFIGLSARVCLKRQDPLLKHHVEMAVSFLVRDMRTEEGLFTSSYDADSEGEEGRFYTWTSKEVEQVLPSILRQDFMRTYDVTPEGNFEGRNILNRMRYPDQQSADIEDNLEKARTLLFQARQKRQKPLHDDKCLCDWNSVLIANLAEAAFVFQNPHWLVQAETTLAAALRAFWSGTQLEHSSRNGRTSHHGMLGDYANIINACLTVFNFAQKQEYLQFAREIGKALDQHFWSEDNKAYWMTDPRYNDLPTNAMPLGDDALTSPNSLMIKNLMRLHVMTGEEGHFTRASAMVDQHRHHAFDNPFATPSLLSALSLQAEMVHITLSGSEPVFSCDLLRQTLVETGLDIAITCIDQPGPPKIILCKGRVCSAPIERAEEIAEALNLLKAHRQIN